MAGATPGVGGFATLALDAEGLPHISYYDAANFGLKYAEASPLELTLGVWLPLALK